MFQKTQMTPNELLSAMGTLAVPDALALRARLHPDKILFTFLDDDGAEAGHLTYRDAWRRARGVADHLERITAAGDRIMLFFPQGLDFIVAFLGCLMAGRIAVPVNLPTRRRVERCAGIIADSGAGVALAPAGQIGGLADCFTGTGAETLAWVGADTLPPADGGPADDALVPAADPGAVAFLQYTSGSTSAPKGVMVTHGNLTANLRMMRDSWELDHTTDMVFWQPHHHDMGLILGQLLPVVLGNRSVLMAPNTFVRRPALWLEAISRYRATLAGGPNFAYALAVERYSEERLAGLDLSCWTVALNGADVVRPATLARFAALHEKHGFRPDSFLPCYGLAEATLFVSGGPVRRPTRITTVDVRRMEADRRIEPPATPEGARALAGCGEPSWEVEVVIADPVTGRPCGPGEVGEICLSGPSVAAGYWRNPEATEKTFRARLDGRPGKGFLRTGDLGFLGPEDRQLYIGGRLKDVIICDGRNLHPEDIEYSILEACEGTRPQSCAVFSHDTAGPGGNGQRQEIVAAIEVDRSIKRRLADDGKRFQAAIRASVAEEHGIAIGRILFVPPTAMRKTTSGKIQRSLMRQLYLSGTLEVIAP